ncbi:MAG: InlB B-repeat-containing protein [Clostridia bacterium]|nr:InlB B-repeat-containing protein [Clostridia bacterium]
MKRTVRLLAVSLLISITAIFLFACSVGGEHTVTFTDESGAVYQTVTVEHGKTVQRPGTPTKTGHLFSGWFYGDSQWNFKSAVNEDITIVAKWMATNVTVAFDTAGSDRIESITLEYGSTLELPTPAPLDDYVFLGWYCGAVKWDNTMPVTASMTLTAAWRPEHVTVKFDTVGGSAAPTPSVIGYGETVSEPATPTKNNAIFLGWYYGESKWDFSTAITENITLYAKWQSEYVYVTFDSAGGSSVETQKIRFNTEASEPADPTRDTYTFAGWYNGTTPFDFSKKITSNITLTAKWDEICVSVTFDSNGGGRVDPLSVHVGTAAKAPFSPTKSGYYFDGWLLDGAPFDFSTVITENITLTAKWISAQDKMWRDYEASLDAKTYTALKKMYDFYDGYSTVNWLARLWDDKLGGFYYSNSARDYEGYLVDLESTNQAISWLKANGVISSVNDLPNSMKLSIVKFAKSTQCATDGYFYHPQWPQGTANLNTDRYGRDLGWATGLINDLKVDTDGDGVEEKQFPSYCAPNGNKCKTHYYGGGSCSYLTSAASLAVTSRADTALTGAFSNSTVSTAVSHLTSSTVTPTATVSSKPDYSSAEAFSAWLEAYNSTIKVDSGKAHNLSALKSEIIAKGYGKIVLDHLDRVQKEVYNEQVAAGETPTGMWQKPVNYRAVWGLLKYSSFYNDGTCGREIKYALEMVDTAIKVINMPADGEYYMNDLFNQWSSINNLISNVKKYNPDKLEAVYAKFRASAPTLIDNSLAKITPFKTADGGFGYTCTGNSLSTIYGVPISKGLVESDVNGTSLCFSMYRAIFTCLGYEVILPCSYEDYARFLRIANTPKPTENFSSGVPDTITETKKTSEYNLSTVTDPKDAGNKVLSFTSGIITTTSDKITFSTLSQTGSCFVFESDLYVKSTSSDGNLFQINMGGAYMIMLHKSGSKVTVMETDTTAKSPTSTTGTASTDEWFNLRVEYYTHTGLGTSTPKIKVFINDKLSAESTLYFGKCDSKTPATQYKTVSFYSMKAVKTVLLIDNCYFKAIDKDYSSTSHSTNDIIK